MANLIISEFSGIEKSGGPIQAPRGLLVSQVVAIGGTSAASSALNEGTALVRIFAEADCDVAIGPAADAEDDAVIPLAAGSFDYITVPRGAGWVVAVVERTVA